MQEEKKAEKPTVQVDFMFLRSEKDVKKEDLLTCLCQYRMDSGAGAANVVMTLHKNELDRRDAQGRGQIGGIGDDRS